MKIKCISQWQMDCLTPPTTPLVGQNLTIKLESVNTIRPLQKTVIWDQKGKRRNVARKTKILHYSIRLNPSQGSLCYLPSSKVFSSFLSSSSSSSSFLSSSFSSSFFLSSSSSSSSFLSSSSSSVSSPFASSSCSFPFPPLPFP